MRTLLFFVIVVLAIEWLFKPRLDYTSDGWWVLWYGKRNRNYIILFKERSPDD